jgi:hypothetical protein
LPAKFGCLTKRWRGLRAIFVSERQHFPPQN